MKAIVIDASPRIIPVIKNAASDPERSEVWGFLKLERLIEWNKINSWTMAASEICRRRICWRNDIETDHRLVGYFRLTNAYALTETYTSKSWYCRKKRTRIFLSDTSVLESRKVFELYPSHSTLAERVLRVRNFARYHISPGRPGRANEEDVTWHIHDIQPWKDLEV